MEEKLKEYNFEHEVKQGKRFGFGKNWQRFLTRLNDGRIQEAEISLKEMLKVKDLNGISFLDIGCGSGLFSLAAMRLGASKILSFDYDSQSVACAQELKRRFYPDVSAWEINQGSVLDESFMQSLGQWDVVYCWGVLHHTGDMWMGLSNAIGAVKRGGKLFVAIYNDQGFVSQLWKAVKKAYNWLPSGLKFTILIPSFLRLWGPTLVRDFIIGKPLSSWRQYSTKRGMSPWDDVVDWVGGYPFEVAKPEEIFRFCHDRDFQLFEMITTNRLGNNELVFILPKSTHEK